MGDRARARPGADPGWRPLAGIETGRALADLQRLALEYRIGLPTTFALVGKTLAQADTIARTLDPELDPVELIEEHALDVIAAETARRIEPNQLLSTLFTQLDPVTRYPRKVGHILARLEAGTLKIGVRRTSGRWTAWPARSRTGWERPSSWSAS